MTIVSRAFDLIVKHEWGSDHRCPECRGWQHTFATLPAVQVGDHIGHKPGCEMSCLLDEILGLRQSDKPVLKQGIEKVRYVNSRPSDRGCMHSAQSWYIKDSLMGCHDCDGD
jgi:hypothetical protein